MPCLTAAHASRCPLPQVRTAVIWFVSLCSLAFHVISVALTFIIIHVGSYLSWLVSYSMF